MLTFIADFGRENHVWKDCLAGYTVATLEDEDLRPFQLVNDREGFIAHCLANKFTAAGIRPTKPVASRWYNLPRIVSSTTGDLWFHREKEQLWWTISEDGPVVVSEGVAPNRPKGSEHVLIYHKPTQAWSRTSKTGLVVHWQGLHAKARQFLFTEGTLQQLTYDNAAYTRALIEGMDLTPWHTRPDWRSVEDKAKRGVVTTFSGKMKAVVRMTMAARGAAASAYGQQVTRTVKLKNYLFASPRACEEYVAALLEAQESACAVTGIPLQFDDEHDDSELLASLDRIDSDGQYEAGNLQIVCRFVTRWKIDGSDAEFRRLIKIVRSASLHERT